MAGPFDPIARLFGKKRSAPAGPDWAAAQDVAFIPQDELRIEVCPLCAARPTGHLSVYPAPLESRMRPRIVWWCDACGSGVVPNARAWLADYYEKAYAAEINTDREIAPEVYFSPAMVEKSHALGRQLRRIDHQIGQLRKLGARTDVVLDFGAGPGYFLKVLDPPTKLAVELDETSRKFLDYIGAKIVRLEDVGDGSLDLIMASHTMEHLCVEEFDGVLATMLGKLRPGGLLYVEVPQAALTALELPYKHEPHTIFFSPAGLDAAIRRAGFEAAVATHRTPGGVTTRANPIWAPDPDDTFQASIGSGMTLVARRPAEPAASSLPLAEAQG